MHTRRQVIASTTAAMLSGYFLPARAQQATPAVLTESSATYAERETGPLTLDIFLPPDGRAPRAAVLLFHGGAWTYGLSGPHDMAGPAAAMAEAGYAAFVPRYRLTDDPAGVHRWPDQLDDAQEAVRWVRSNADRFGFDPEKIAAYGHSAGGHLSSHLGTRDARPGADTAFPDVSSRVHAVIPMTSHFDLSIPYPGAFDQERIAAILGGAPEEVPDVTDDASPITWVDASSAPFLIIFGGIDEMSPTVQSRSMIVALQEAGVSVGSWEDATSDHFFVADWAQSGPWTLAFLAAVFGA